MSLFNTLNVAPSGLGASSQSLAVIGDNISNITTTGFKGNRAEFSDQLPQDVYAKGGPTQLGSGVGMTRISSIFAQGAISSSQNSLDMAIGGDGFFVVSDDVSNYYTRAGEFYLDDQGFIINSDGLNLQGYNATDGTLGSTLEDLQIDLQSIAPDATTEITMAANLSAEADFTTTPVAALTLNTGTGDTLETAANSADFSTSVTIYDSLGVAHEVTVVYERTGTNDWSWYALADAGDVEIGALGSTGTSGTAFEIAQGTLTFDTNGDLTTFTQTDATGWNFEGPRPTPPTSSTSVWTPPEPRPTARLTQYNGDSAVSSVTQDGYGTGVLTSLSVNTEGIITGAYSNGEELVMGQVALARFQSNQASTESAATCSGRPSTPTVRPSARPTRAGEARSPATHSSRAMWTSRISSWT